MCPATLKRAMEHPVNFLPIVYCTIGMVVVGILMFTVGLIVLIIDSAELGPPQQDNQYDRYSGSNMAHIISKLQP